MSSNVGLSTPRGSGTSGYVQRNHAFMKPRATGSGAPYPPLSAGADRDGLRSFKQRQPDRQILEHDRRREVEVRVMEERERLEEMLDKQEEEEEKEEKEKEQAKGKKEDDDNDNDNDNDGKEEKKEKLTEELIEEKCEALRARLLSEMEADSARPSGKGKSAGAGAGAGRDKKPKAYQVHELAEAKIEESERLRRALGIKEDVETGEISSLGGERRRRD